MKIKPVFCALCACAPFLFASCFGMGWMVGYDRDYDKGYDYEYSRSGKQQESQTTTSTTTRRTTKTTTTPTETPASTQPAQTTQPQQPQPQQAKPAFSDRDISVFYSNAFSSDTTITFYPASSGKKRFVFKTVYNGLETVKEGSYDVYPLPEKTLNLDFDDGDGYNALCTETGKILYVPGLGSFERVDAR